MFVWAVEKRVLKNNVKFTYRFISVDFRHNSKEMAVSSGNVATTRFLSYVPYPPLPTRWVHLNKRPVSRTNTDR